MTETLTSISQSTPVLDLIHDLFGNPSTEYQGMIALCEHGYVFEKTYYNLKAKNPDGQLFSLTLPVATPNLVAHANPAVKAAAKKIITGWLVGLMEKLPAVVSPADDEGFVEVESPEPPLTQSVFWIKWYRDTKKVGLKEAKAAYDAKMAEINAAKVLIEGSIEPPITSATKVKWIKWYREQTGASMPDAIKAFEAKHAAIVKAGPEINPVASEAKPVEVDIAPPKPTTPKGFTPMPTAKPEPKPTMKVIDLKDAVALGQPVKGTSDSSVYKVVAIAEGETMKIAARQDSPGNLSLRIELSKSSPELVGRIKQAGFSWKGNYGSVHCTLGQVPRARVLGAMLFSLNVKFDRMINNEQEWAAL